MGKKQNLAKAITIAGRLPLEFLLKIERNEQKQMFKRLFDSLDTNLLTS